MAKKQAGVKTKNPNSRGTREQAGIVIEIKQIKRNKQEVRMAKKGAGKSQKSKQRALFTESL